VKFGIVSNENRIIINNIEAHESNLSSLSMLPTEKTEKKTCENV
jgi:hypothetical protein